jgi:archaeal flagellar protein FlaD
MGDSAIQNKNNSIFDVSKELSTLVSKNILPRKIALKLDSKLKEKNIKLSKEQFYLLIDKITGFLNGYNNIEKPNYSASKNIADNSNMQTLLETLEKLEERIASLEEGKTDEYSGLEVSGAENTKVVTTDDIKVPKGNDWDWQPLKNVPNDPESIIVLMKWLQYLIDRCGRDNLSNILDYYVDIGWISQDAKINLIDYSHGIADENREKSETKKNITDLPSKDHIQSFIFIQKLKGVALDKHFVDRIDGNISSITKKLENYNFK